MQSREKGQALLEMVLVLPVLLGMITAIFASGVIFSSQLVVVNAAREGARLGSLGKTKSEVESGVTSYLQAGNLNAASASIVVAGAGNASGQTVDVKVAYDIQLWIPVPGMPDTLNLKARSVMRIE